jgi:hypothetical protein
MGLLVAILGGIAASPVNHPFPQLVHDWAVVLVSIATAVGLHFAADAAPKKEDPPHEQQPS